MANRKADAERYLIPMSGVLRPPVKGEPLTFPQAAEQVDLQLLVENRSKLTRVGYRRHLRTYAGYVASRPDARWYEGDLVLPQDEEVALGFVKWLITPRRQGAAPQLSEAAVQTALYSVKGSHKRLHRYVAIDPFQEVQRQRPHGLVQSRRLQPEEKAKLRKWAREHKDPRVLPWIELGLTAGMRFAEATNLTWGNALGDDLYFLGKGDLWRHVPRSQYLTELVQHLRAYTPHHGPQDLVLQGRAAGDHLSRKYVHDHWTSLIRDDDLVPDFRYHMLRRTFAQDLLDRGVSPMQVATLLGHQDITTLHRFYSFNHSMDVSRAKKVLEEISPVPSTPEASD